MHGMLGAGQLQKLFPRASAFGVEYNDLLPEFSIGLSFDCK